jgi:hypothetical protein
MKHIKTGLLAAAALLAGTVIYGQAKEASVMIDKENRHAVMITVDQPEKNTREALQQRLERSGLKEKSRNGSTKYLGVTLSEISADKVDLYTKVEPGPNNSSVVYMAVSRGYNNFTNGAADSSITQNVKTFLESFIQDANNHSADMGITNQLNDISKDEKNYQNLLDEQTDLQKKRSNIDNRLSAIQAELNTRKEDLDKKKVSVKDAKTKRSNIVNP